jgi:hypothetical protein
MKAGEENLYLPTQVQPVPVLEDILDETHSLPPLDSITYVIIDTLYIYPISDDMTFEEIQCLPYFALKISEIANRGRMLGVNWRRELVIYESDRVPRDITDIHHINQQRYFRAGNFTKYPLIEVQEVLDRNDPIAGESLLKEKDSFINMVRLIRDFHCKLHNLKNPLRFIKTPLGSIDPHELIAAFVLFNISDRADDIRATMDSYPRSELYRSFNQTRWRLNIVEEAANTLAFQRPQLFDLWCYYIHQVPIKRRYEQ